MLKESQEVKQYIGMTANTFKERYNNHKKSFKNPLYQNETELSKYLWKLKETKKEFSVKWSVMSVPHRIRLVENLVFFVWKKSCVC